MYRIDDSQPSLLVIHFDTPLTVESAGLLFAYLDGQLDRKQPFGFAMVSNSEGQHAKGVAKMQKDWTKANRQRLAQLCAGIAIVTQSSRYIALYRPIANVMIQRMYNCPGQLFTDLDAAKTWLSQQLVQFKS